MHELSITRSLLDQALAEADKHGAKRISRIRLLLGEAGSVVPDCVQFYFAEMSKGTVAAEAELEFKRVPLRIRCPKCGAEWGPRPSSHVPRPSSPSLDHSTTGSLDHALQESPDHSTTGPLDHTPQEPLDHSTTGPLDHFFQDMCSCNAGGEIVSGQDLVIESIDVD